jgi:hypothetical protein
MVERVERLLNRLGKFETPDQLADYLRSEGIKGVPTDPKDCPMARLLNRGREKSPYRYRMGAAFVRQARKNEGDEGRTVKSYKVPDVVSRFVVRFDSGLYPDLMEVGQ